MKNKKLLYILIPATCLLWGMIIFKIFGVVNGNDNKTAEINNMAPKVFGDIQNDTFSIYPDYRDPFSGKLIKKNIPAVGTPHPAKIKTIDPTVIQWPSVVYGGVIKNQKSSKQLVLVQVNGQGNIMQAGDKAGEIQLTKIFHDSIEVMLGKEKKIIKK